MPSQWQTTDRHGMKLILITLSILVTLTVTVTVTDYNWLTPCWIARQQSIHGPFILDMLDTAHSTTRDGFRPASILILPFRSIINNNNSNNKISIRIRVGSCSTESCIHPSGPESTAHPSHTRRNPWRNDGLKLKLKKNKEMALCACVISRSWTVLSTARVGCVYLPLPCALCIFLHTLLRALLPLTSQTWPFSTRRGECTTWKGRVLTKAFVRP